MATNSGQTAAHLGYFDAFMRAWGKADAAVRQEAYDAVQAYRSGTLTADQEVRTVSIDLGVPIPPGW